MPNRPIRLSIVNDSEIIVRGVVAMLAPFADRVAVVDTVVGQETEAEDSDIVLFDTFAHALSTPVDGQALRQRYRTRRVVIYTWNVAPAARQDALSGGVDGYLSKQLTGAALVDALERVHAGETVLDVTDAQGDAQTAWPGQDHGLTERESEILVLIVRGLNNDDIADYLYLSINTVKTYIRTAYRKIGADSRSQALLWGIDHGFRTADRASQHRDS